MAKFSAILIALLMLAAGSWLVLFDPALPTSTATATATVAAPPLPKPRPVLINGTVPLTLNAQSFISAYIAPTGEVDILTEKDGERPWPLASISKLFTAMLVLDEGNLAGSIVLTPADVPELADPGLFQAGQSFTRNDVLHSLLIESSNNAAIILANQRGSEEFVKAMNAKASELGLKRTHFTTPHGLDLASGEASNYSTAEDLVQAALVVTKQYPEIWDITKLAEYKLSQSDGNFHHNVISTNKLIEAISAWPATLVGAKTGQTNAAKKNLLLVLRDQKTGGYLINVVLGSEDHFADMTWLTNWVYQSYKF